MSATCILTDSSVQFLNSDAQTYEHLFVIPHHLGIESELVHENPDLQPTEAFAIEHDPSQVTLQPPSVEDFRQILVHLSQSYSEIIVILISAHLSPAYENACQAAYQLRGAVSIQIIDSQTIGAGLGMLVQIAIDALRNDSSSIQVNRLVRGMISHVYTIFCLQSLHHLAHSGHLDPAQAAIGEMLGIIPFYVLDSGKLVPVQKARSMRQLVDVLHEFVTEFERVDHIALMHGSPPSAQEMRNLNERLVQDFPDTPISEHLFSAAMTVLLGPRSFGIAILEHIQES